MSGKTSITVAGSAFEDLEDIQFYYDNEGVPEVGKQIVGEIIGQIERLSPHPMSGRIVPEFNIKQLREIIHPPFRIVYRCDKNKVRVVRIWRSERRLKLP